MDLQCCPLYSWSPVNIHGSLTLFNLIFYFTVIDEVWFLDFSVQMWWQRVMWQQQQVISGQLCKQSAVKTHLMSGTTALILDFRFYTLNFTVSVELYQWVPNRSSHHSQEAFLTGIQCCRNLTLDIKPYVTREVHFTVTLHYNDVFPFLHPSLLINSEEWAGQHSGVIVM